MAGIQDYYRSKESEKLFRAPEHKLIDGRAVKFSDVRVHEINMGDVEDPDLMVAQPIWQWQESEAGQWVMEHAVEPPFWHRVSSPYSYGWTYYIIARLTEQDQTFWALKWKNS